MEEEKKIAGMSRRSFTLGTGGAVVLLALGGLKAVPAQAVVRPPGGQDEDHLISACIRCERCVEACPNHALTPSHLENGILGVRTPTVQYDKGWCDFCAESNDSKPQCVAACPTAALRLDDLVTAKTIRTGIAAITKDWCLSYAKYNGCRFCYDACPYEAITLDDYKRPVIVEDKCTGCGACQNACVSMKEGSISEGATHRAIIVTPINA